MHFAVSVTSNKSLHRLKAFLYFFFSKIVWECFYFTFIFFINVLNIEFLLDFFKGFEKLMCISSLWGTEPLCSETHCTCCAEKTGSIPPLVASFIICAHALSTPVFSLYLGSMCRGHLKNIYLRLFMTHFLTKPPKLVHLCHLL